MISLVELIEHLNDKDLSLLLNECKRVLKKNGKILFTTPNYLSLWPLLEIILNFISPLSYKHQHINKFNKKRLHMFLKSQDFKVMKLGTFILIAPFLSPNFVSSAPSRIIRFSSIGSSISFILMIHKEV